MASSSAFALALAQMPGVGRVTAGRLLRHFPAHTDLLRYPREQVLARIRGAPNGEALVGRLFDRAAMEALLEQAADTLEALSRKRVAVLSAGGPAWPGGLRELPRADRPFLLYAYGDAAVLHAPCAAFFARPPLSEPAFEQAQALVRHLALHGIAPVTGTTHGFDVVVHKITALDAPTTPSALVAPCGLARLAPPIRPTVSLAVRSGGVCLSPFAMDHGPFEHDDRERALTQAALTAASLFFEPRPQTPEWSAMAWALEAGRPVFGVAAAEAPLPPRVHPIQNATDFDWIVAAVQALPRDEPEE